MGIIGGEWGSVWQEGTAGGQGAGALHNMMPYSCAELFNSILETILIVLFKTCFKLGTVAVTYTCATL